MKPKQLIKGLALIVVPVIIIGAGVYYFAWMSPKTGAIASLNKGFGVTFDHPPPDFFDRNSQLMVGFGLCLASICWGVAKVISALRAPRGAETE
jgi:hypothetical protein